MKRGVAPTAKQKKWHDWLASFDCYICQQKAEVHHCVGSTGKHQKVHIGQDFCVPLCGHCHRGPQGIHGDLSAFDGHKLGERRKEIEKTIFNHLVAVYRRQHGEYPCPPDVLAAIEGYHK